VQSIVDARWRDDAGAIYGAYESYYQTSDRDQTTYLAGRPESRTELFIGHVLAHAAPARGARVLDYGCGAGNVLRALAEVRPDLVLEGFDLDDREARGLTVIPGFAELHAGTIPDDATFDLIVLSHSLEHLEDPGRTLADLLAHLAPGGHVAVAVPDCEADPYKLFIADHCSHFSAVGLRVLLRHLSVHSGSIPTHVHSRELWAVGVAADRSVPIRAVFDDGWLRANLDYLGRVRGDAMDLAARVPVTLFGTSVSAMWLLGELAERVEAFVDEDPARVGRHVHGRPILHPRDLGLRATVLVPFAPPLGAAIARRLAQHGGEWHVLGDGLHRA